MRVNTTFITWVACSLTLAYGVSTPPAHAQDPPPAAAAEARAKQLFVLGAGLFEAGRYEAAAEVFEEAYRLSGRHLLLYNIASARERQGKHAEAIAAIERLIPHLPEAERATARQRVEVLRAEQAKHADASPSRAPANASPQQLTLAPQRVRLHTPAPSPWRWGVLTAGITTIVGGGIVTTLGALDTRALRRREDAGGSPDAATLAEREALRLDAQEKTRAGYAIMGLGGALTITSAILFLTAPSPDAELQLGVSPGPDANMLLLRGRF